MPTAETFTFDLAGIDAESAQPIKDLRDIAQLDTMVTVVDSSVFDKFFNEKSLASDKFEDIAQADTRQIFHLLTQQIEFANVILLNKIDLISRNDIDRIKRTIRQFNSKAEIYETTNSKIDLTKVINTGKFDFKDAESFNNWLV